MARKTWGSEVLTSSDLNTLVVQAAPGSSRTLHIGTFSGTTDSSGYITVTHGAGFTPTVVLVTWTTSGLGGGVGPFMGADSIGATTFRTRLNLGNLTAVSGCYLCAA